MKIFHENFWLGNSKSIYLEDKSAILRIKTFFNSEEIIIPYEDFNLKITAIKTRNKRDGVLRFIILICFTVPIFIYHFKNSVTLSEEIITIILTTWFLLYFFYLYKLTSWRKKITIYFFNRTPLEFIINKNNYNDFEQLMKELEKRHKQTVLKKWKIYISTASYEEKRRSIQIMENEDYITVKEARKMINQLNQKNKNYSL